MKQIIKAKSFRPNFEKGDLVKLTLKDKNNLDGKRKILAIIKKICDDNKRRAEFIDGSGTTSLRSYYSIEKIEKIAGLKDFLFKKNGLFKDHELELFKSFAKGDKDE